MFAPFLAVVPGPQSLSLWARPHVCQQIVAKNWQRGLWQLGGGTWHWEHDVCSDSPYQVPKQWKLTSCGVWGEDSTEPVPWRTVEDPGAGGTTDGFPGQCWGRQPCRAHLMWEILSLWPLASSDLRFREFSGSPGNMHACQLRHGHLSLSLFPFLRSSEIHLPLS